MRFVNVRRAAGVEPLPPMQNGDMTPVELVETPEESA
jgi:hypothetical protein